MVKKRSNIKLGENDTQRPELSIFLLPPGFGIMLSLLPSLSLSLCRFFSLSLFSHYLYFLQLWSELNIFLLLPGFEIKLSLSLLRFFSIFFLIISISLTALVRNYNKDLVSFSFFSILQSYCSLSLFFGFFLSFLSFFSFFLSFSFLFLPFFLSFYLFLWLHYVAAS